MRAIGIILLFLECHLFIRGYCYGFHRQSESRIPMRSRAEALSERRRDFISSIGVASSLLPWYPSIPYSSQAYAEEISYQRLTSTKKIAQYIHRFCNSEFLSSVIKSRCNYLYRGLSPNESEAVAYNNGLAAIIVKDEPHDLLNPDTYQSNEAASYFLSLEKDMTAKRISIKPSNSHLGTTCPKDAAQWGTAASIWPLGEKGVDFAWLEDGGIFWPIKRGNHIKKRLIVTSSTNCGDSRESKELSEALQGDAWEVMFRADNGFLAVPAELDDELRKCLMEMK